MFEKLTSLLSQIDWLGGVAETLIGAAIGAAGAVGAFQVQRSLQKRQIRKRNHITGDCPILETAYVPVTMAHPQSGLTQTFYEQRIRTVGEIDLAKIFKTSADTYIGYIHKAAKLALESENPVVFEHLESVIPQKLCKTVMTDIAIEMRAHFSRILNPPGTYRDAAMNASFREATVYPVLVAERAAERMKIRVMMMYPSQLETGGLPGDVDDILVQVGEDKYIHAPDHPNAMHLNTRNLLAHKLTVNDRLRGQVAVKYRVLDNI